MIMNTYDFWKTWKNRNELEEKAVDSVIKARDLVISSVPDDTLVAIYTKNL